MHTRVRIEYEGQEKQVVGFASTDHPESSYGQPVIVIGGQAHGSGDLAALNGRVVTSDRELAGRLEKAGYGVRISDPQSKWRSNNIQRVTVSFTKPEYDKLMAYCEANGIVPNAAIKGWVRSLDK